MPRNTQRHKSSPAIRPPLRILGVGIRLASLVKAVVNWRSFRVLTPVMGVFIPIAGVGE